MSSLRLLSRSSQRGWRSSFSSSSSSNLRIPRRWHSSSTTTNETLSSASASTITKQQDEQQQKSSSPVKPMEPRLLYRYLQLEKYDTYELELAFDRILASSSTTENAVAEVPTLEQDLAAEEMQTTDDESAAASPIVVDVTTTITPKLDVLTEDAIRNFFVKRIQDFEAEQGLLQQHSSPHMDSQRHDYATLEMRQFTKLFDHNHNVLTKAHFRDTIATLTASVDYGKTMPVTISMLLVGTSVGIISPVMPFVVEEMGLSAGQYGLVVSAFALAKITANVPSAVLVERHGRKPYMVHSLSLIALGTGGIGICSSFEQLYVCRLLVGLGVAALSSASTLSIADLSNPKNRAQTMAPIMSAFAAGTALGPAMGGILADKLGLHETFYVVGACFLTMTVVNQMLLSETQLKDISYPWHVEQQAGTNNTMNVPGTTKKRLSMLDATRDALKQWAPLLRQTKIRNVVVINGFYWVALAGAQMTLLPLLLTNPQGLAMTATGVGQVYMGMSLVQVLGNPICAKLIDGFGKVPAMIAGCSLIATGMATLPLATDLTTVALTLGIWSTGSTMLSTAPVAYISDVTEDETRAQAIALLRTSGDVGFLVGASAVGAVMDWAGNMEVAMQSSAGLLVTATAWFGARQYLTTTAAAAAAAVQQQAKKK